MTVDRIDPSAITVAEGIIKKSGYAVPSRAVLEAAISAALPGKEFARTAWMAAIASDQHFEDWWAQRQRDSGHEASS